MSAKYPLNQLVRIKKRRLEEAERVLKQKRKELENEIEKQKQAEKVCNECKQHKEDKLNQLRTKLDEGTTSDKVKVMKDYLLVVDEELKEKEKKVEDQIQEVKKAREKVETARQDFLKKQQDIEKLSMHYEEWKKEMSTLAQYEEGLETDELGSVIHNLKKRKRTK